MACPKTTRPDLCPRSETGNNVPDRVYSSWSELKQARQMVVATVFSHALFQMEEWSDECIKPDLKNNVLVVPSDESLHTISQPTQNQTSFFILHVRSIFLK